MRRLLCGFLFIFLVLFSFDAKASSDTYCMAEAIYYEARNQSFKGQIAVGNVILNRVKSDNYPNSICEVVNQKYKGVCQFSYKCQKISKPNKSLLNKFIIISKRLIELDKDFTDGSTHYHADYVQPRWSKKLNLVFIEGNHIFYRY